MLLYYLHNPSAPGLVPECASCHSPIENVRWHKFCKIVDDRPRIITAPLSGAAAKATNIAASNSMRREELCSQCFSTAKEKSSYIPIRVSFQHSETLLNNNFY